MTLNNPVWTPNGMGFNISADRESGYSYGPSTPNTTEMGFGGTNVPPGDSVKVYMFTARNKLPNVKVLSWYWTGGNPYGQLGPTYGEKNSDMVLVK